ncbi:MAG TPA: hypothetical protein IAC15_01330 [Candidatus Onthomonas avicola]|nr:hypothetical protein [Candidatus Onthomonas avicola]
MNQYKVKHPRGDLSFEIAFTKAHRDAVRQYDRIEQIEVACRRAQYPAILHPVQEEDVLAGRVEMGYVGFGMEHQTGGFGFYCNEKKLVELLETQAGDAKYREDVHDLITYWKGRTSNHILLYNTPPEIKPALFSDNWRELPLPASPIVRISGTYVNYDKLCRIGLNGLAEEIRGHLQAAQQEGRDTVLYQCMLDELEHISEVCLWYARQVEEQARQEGDPVRRKKLQRMCDALNAIASRAPQSLQEAAQLAWIYTIMTPATEFGRLDVYLGDFYCHDVDNGILTEEEALEIIQSLFRLMDSLDCDTTGRLFVGGYGRRNPENADRFCLTAIEACRTVREILPQFSIRFNRQTPKEVWDACLNCIEEGRTYPILYNDDVLVGDMQKAFGVDRALAEQYMPLGCGEIEFDHYSYGTPSGSLNCLKILELAIRGGYEPMTGWTLGGDTPLTKLVDCASFEEFYDSYKRLLTYYIRAQAKYQKYQYEKIGTMHPFLEASMLYDGCLERGRAVFDGGCYHYGGTLENYGNVNAANSLAAIKKAVFEDHSVTAQELVEAMDANFYGYERVRKRLMDCPKYGNDDDYVDAIFVDLHLFISQTIRAQAPLVGLDSYLGVTINNAQNTTLGRWVGATPDGRKAGMPMANANNPAPGTDQNGLPAMLNSLLKPPHDVHAGMVQNLRLSRETFSENREKIHGLIQSYFDRGGAQLMISVVGREDLKRAMEHPEDYKDLIVRIGGLSQRFVALNKDVQQEIYDRTTY